MNGPFGAADSAANSPDIISRCSLNSSIFNLFVFFWARKLATSATGKKPPEDLMFPALSCSSINLFLCSNLLISISYFSKSYIPSLFTRWYQSLCISNTLSIFSPLCSPTPTRSSILRWNKTFSLL